MYEPFPFPDCRVEQVTRAGPEKVELALRATRPEAACPTCLTPSNAIHSYYRRHPADLPGLGQAVCLNLSVRRFCCRNPACPRQTFAEPLPGLLNRRARHHLVKRASRFEPLSADGRRGNRAGAVRPSSSRPHPSRHRGRHRKKPGTPRTSSLVVFLALPQSSRSSFQTATSL
jgi:hypothetical protein